MFTLTIPKSTSKKYPAVLRVADRIGCTLSDGRVVISLSDVELLNQYKNISGLVELVHKWKGVTSTYNDFEVDPFRFVFVTWDKIRKCAEKRNATANKRHCWTNHDTTGWGCKMITCIKREIDPREAHLYQLGKYWYNYGEREGSAWHVDKMAISEMILRHVEENNLPLCPYFDMERVKRKIDALPDVIQLDGVNFVPYYREGYPVNIRHTHQHFAFKQRSIFVMVENYSELCFLNYVSTLENNLTFDRISEN